MPQPTLPPLTRRELAPYLDHTLLRPEATVADIVRLCEEALEFGFHSVCVNPRYVKTAASMLVNSTVVPCTVIGFPLGASSTRAKVAEACVALEDGARELDMVMALGAAKAGDWEGVERDIAAVVSAAGECTVVKVIIECCLLTSEEKVAACKAAVRAGAAFVKTSTGFSTGGATVADVRLMRETVGLDTGVKASGGIKLVEDAFALITAGANRLGTSNGVALVSG